MEHYIEATPKIKQYIESLLPSMLSQLGLTRSRKLLHIKVDQEAEHPGTCIPFIGLNTMLIVLQPNKDLAQFGVTLAHELTHVAQFAKGILQCAPKGKRWKGKFYGDKIKYLDQPWEIQAFAQQEIVFRRAIE